MGTRLVVANNHHQTCPEIPAPLGQSEAVRRAGISRGFGSSALLLSVWSRLTRVRGARDGSQTPLSRRAAMDAPVLRKRREVERDSRPARAAGAYLGLHRRGRLRRCAQGRAVFSKLAQKGAPILRQGNLCQRYLPHEEALSQGHRPAPVLLSPLLPRHHDHVCAGARRTPRRRAAPAWARRSRTARLYDRRERKISWNIA